MRGLSRHFVTIREVKPLVITVASVGAGLIAAAFVMKRSASAPRVSLTLEEALEYRSLTPLHKELRCASFEFMVLCMDSPRTRKGAGPTHGPHALARIRTYANKIASDHRADSDFPVGSVFVKEKLPMFDRNAKPDFITTMKKIRAGSGIDTWQFMLIDLKAKKVLQDYETSEGGGIGRKEESIIVGKAKTTCVTCHGAYTSTFGISPAGMRDLRLAQKSTGRK